MSPLRVAIASLSFVFCTDALSSSISVSCWLMASIYLWLFVFKASLLSSRVFLDSRACIISCSTCLSAVLLIISLFSLYRILSAISCVASSRLISSASDFALTFLVITPCIPRTRDLRFASFAANSAPVISSASLRVI